MGSRISRCCGVSFATDPDAIVLLGKSWFCFWISGFALGASWVSGLLGLACVILRTLVQNPT